MDDGGFLLCRLQHIGDESLEVILIDPQFPIRHCLPGYWESESLPFFFLAVPWKSLVELVPISLRHDGGTGLAFIDERGDEFFRDYSLDNDGFRTMQAGFAFICSGIRSVIALAGSAFTVAASIFMGVVIVPLHVFRYTLIFRIPFP